MRVSELVGANLEDFDAERGLLLVRGKGKKERMLPVGNSAMLALRTWIARRPEVIRGKTTTESNGPQSACSPSVRVSTPRTHASAIP